VEVHFLVWLATEPIEADEPSASRECVHATTKTLR
jgi:hypothetical protein